MKIFIPKIHYDESEVFVMKNYLYLSIPIIIGIFVGFVLAYDTMDKEDPYFTPNSLTQDGSPILGKNDAEITILEWGDYQCTYCYNFHKSTLPVILNEYVETGRVNIVFKDFPLNGPDSVLAAEATYCAEDQKKYWQYHNELYSNWAGERTGWITIDALTEFASEIGLDLNKFNSCLQSHKYHQKVRDLEKFGLDIGIDATPSFLIFDDKKIVKIRGNQPLDSFRRVIEDLENKT